MWNLRLFLTVAAVAGGGTFFGCRTGGAGPDQSIRSRGPLAAKPFTTGLVLIPAGEFLMGKDGRDDHSPAHRIMIDSFYLDKYEVTNAQYLEFCQETGRALPEFWGMKEFHSGSDFPNHPVVGISWFEARAYAEWAGKRLPTEAEWEYAGCGGLVGQEYPHGSDLTPASANYTIHGAPVQGAVPVGSYPPNGYGLHDMAGNVVEWVADYYDKDYYASSPDTNPTGPPKGKFRVIRGGGWHSGPTCNRVYYRNALFPTWRDFNIGFRWWVWYGWRVTRCRPCCQGVITGSDDEEVFPFLGGLDKVLGRNGGFGCNNQHPSEVEQLEIRRVERSNLSYNAVPLLEQAGLQSGCDVPGTY